VYGISFDPEVLLLRTLRQPVPPIAFPLAVSSNRRHFYLRIFRLDLRNASFQLCQDHNAIEPKNIPTTLPQTPGSGKR
jgi:hypothetical protein